MQIRIHQTNDELESIIIPMGGTLVRNQPDPSQVRKGLTRVYDFKRGADGALVCEVTDERDIKRFLSLIDGFSPYGEESITEARELWRWTGEHAEADDAPKLAAGQPAIVDVFIDDDDDDKDPVDPVDQDDDELDQRGAGLQTGLPDIPAANADGDAWMAYGKALPGVSNPKNHAELSAYASANYGVDLKTKGTVKMLQEIAGLQSATA